jgi:hypothetical protein
MREEELERIERGDPQPVGEAIITLALGLGVLALLVFIVLGAW